MSWQSSPASSVADLERLLHQVEDRLERLSRRARSSSAGPRAVDRVGDAIAAALTDIAERFRGGARMAGSDIAERFRGGARMAGSEASQLGDEALKLGNEALRTLTKEVEQRPLVTLAVAFGVGMLAAGLLARRI